MFRWFHLGNPGRVRCRRSTHYHSWSILALCDCHFKSQNHDCRFSLKLVTYAPTLTSCALKRFTGTRYPHQHSWAELQQWFCSPISLLFLLYSIFDQSWNFALIRYLTSSLSYLLFSFLLFFPRQVSLLLFTIQLPPWGYQISNFPIANFYSCGWNSGSLPSVFIFV